MAGNNSQHSALERNAKRSRTTGAPAVKWEEGAAAPSGAASGVSEEAGTIFINSHFDGGNIEIVDMSEPSNIRLRIHEDPFTESEGKHHYQWFFYRVSGARGAQLAMHLDNAGSASFPEAWQGYQAVASYDSKHWFRVPTSYDAAKGVLLIEHTPEKDAVHYAFFAPYSFAMHLSLVSEMQAADGVRLRLLGETLDGHDIDQLQIGEPGEGKRVVWVVARQHPGESMAEWFVEGMLRALLDPHHGLPKDLLSKAVFYVVPNMNPDGTWRGHLRTNAVGANLNREWQAPSQENSPEVYWVVQRMQETGCDLFIDVHGDEALPYNFIAGNEGIPAWDDRLKGLQSDFVTSFRRANPDFQNGEGYGIDAPGEANMTTASSAVGEKFKCLAFTLEMPFKDTEHRPDPAQGWSPERAMALGASILQPIGEALPNLR